MLLPVICLSRHVCVSSSLILLVVILIYLYFLDILTSAGVTLLRANSAICGPLLLPAGLLPWWLSGKEYTCQCREPGFNPWLGRSPGEGNGEPLHYSCLGNPTDRRSLEGCFHGVTKESDMTWWLLLLLLLSRFQSCPTLCDPIDGSPPGSPVPGILQARTLKWAAISFSNAWKYKVKVKSLSLSDSSRPHGLQPTRLLCP